MSSKGRSIERTSDHFAVIDHGVLVGELVAISDSQLIDSLSLLLFSISQNSNQKRTGSRDEKPYGYYGLLDQWIWLSF